jgi:hypothetical protein
VGAVGKGLVEVDCVDVVFADVELVDVEFELLVELPEALPLEAGAFEVNVNVMGMATVKASVWRFESRETPVEIEVETVTRADALLFCYDSSSRVENWSPAELT